METALFIVGAIVFAGVSTVVILCFYLFSKRGETMIHQTAKLLAEKLDQLVEAQRLSTILKLEPSSLKVRPEDFEPNRPILKAKMRRVLTEKKSSYLSSPDTDTFALIILHHSGWRGFVDYKTSEMAQKALSRLLSNDDYDAADRLIEELVDKL